MLLLVSERMRIFFKSLIFSSQFNTLTDLQRWRFSVDKLKLKLSLPCWNRISKITLLVLAVVDTKSAEILRHICNLWCVIYWLTSENPKISFFQKQGVVSYKIAAVKWMWGTYRGTQTSFQCILHFGYKFLLTEAITCQVLSLRINFERCFEYVQHKFLLNIKF